MIKNIFISALFIYAPLCLSANEKSPSPSIDTGKRILDIVNSEDHSSFAGVVFVAVKGKVIINLGVGKSDIDHAIPFSSNTLIDIGSITKQFTASAILKLEMLGKLSTQDKASRYIPSLQGALKNVTIHELLTHTSGITEDTGGDYEKITAVGLVNHLNQMQLSYSSGSHHYSNLGYSLLALIVETVSGEPLDKFLALELFTPIGMLKTGYTHPNYNDKEVSHGYLDGKDWGYPHKKNWTESGPYWNLRGNGGMLSTAEDMYKWHNALRNKKLLSDTATEKLFAMHVREYPGTESYYGYGWVTEILPNNKKVIWHNGGNGIFSADVRYYPSSDIFYFIAGNRSDVEVYDMSDKINELVSQL